jgi:hypothetical protein
LNQIKQLGLDKAPEKVVDEQRQKLTQAKANCQQLNEQIKNLQ